MKHTTKIALIAATFVLAACGGGGGGTSPTSQNTTPQTPTVETPPATMLSTVTMTSGMDPWFHTQQAAADGTETLVLSTIDGANIRALTAPTALKMIKADATGVSDVTNQYFDTAPSTYWSRNLISFKDDAGNQALYVCNQGRETTLPNTAIGVNGVWGEQDRLFVMRNGKYVDESSALPQGIDFTHGCAVANMGDGKTTLVKNRFGITTPTKSLMTLNGGNYTVAANLDAVYAGGETKGTFAVASADFTKTGTDDVVFGNSVIRKTGVNSYATLTTITPPVDYATAGYTIVHNLVAADLNNDGYADLLVTYSGSGDVIGGPSFLAGAKLAAYINDKAGNLVLNQTAIPAHDETEFGLDQRVIDVNFDGKADIVTSGHRYVYSNLINPTDTSVRSVLLGNGDGTFAKKTINDAALASQCATACQTETFFLKNADGSYNIVAYGKNAAGANILYGRTVTLSTPLTLQ